MKQVLITVAVTVLHVGMGTLALGVFDEVASRRSAPDQLTVMAGLIVLAVLGSWAFFLWLWTRSADTPQPPSRTE